MLLYIVWHSHQTWLGLHSYALLFVFAMLSGAMVVYRGFRSRGLTQEDYNLIVPMALAGILLGARLTHCFCYEWGYYSQHPLEVLLPLARIDGQWQWVGYHGLASHGATFGLMLAVWLFAWMKRADWRMLFDFFAVATPVAGFFIRLGNLCNSEILGTPCSMPWAFLFADVDPLPRHPVQLYEALAYAFIFVGSVLIWKRNKHGHGFLLGYNLTAVSVCRLLIEMFKEEQADYIPQLLTMGQWLTLPFLAFGIVMMCVSKQKEI